MIETLPRAREAAWREEGRCLPRLSSIRRECQSPKTEMMPLQMALAVAWDSTTVSASCFGQRSEAPARLRHNSHRREDRFHARHGYRSSFETRHGILRPTTPCDQLSNSRNSGNDWDRGTRHQMPDYDRYESASFEKAMPPKRGRRIPLPPFRM
jgi:hypothetical protein